MDKELDNNNFDQFFQEKFASHEEIPSVGMWDKIEKEFSSSEGKEFDEAIRNSLANHEGAPSAALRRKVLGESSSRRMIWWRRGAAAALLLITAGVSTYALWNEDEHYSVRQQPVLPTASETIDFPPNEEFLFKRNLTVMEPIENHEKETEQIVQDQLNEEINTIKDKSNNNSTTTIVTTITTTTTISTTTIIGADTSSNVDSFQEKESTLERVITPLEDKEDKK